MKEKMRHKTTISEELNKSLVSDNDLNKKQTELLFEILIDIRELLIELKQNAGVSKWGSKL